MLSLQDCHYREELRLAQLAKDVAMMALLPEPYETKRTLASSARRRIT